MKCRKGFDFEKNVGLTMKKGKINIPLSNNKHVQDLFRRMF